MQSNDKVNKPSTVEQNTVNVEQSTSNILQSNNNVEQNIDVVVLSLGLNLYRPLKILLHKRILKKWKNYQKRKTWMMISPKYLNLNRFQI